jgi:hypothetical protein
MADPSEGHSVPPGANPDEGAQFTPLELNELLNRVRNIETELRNLQGLAARTYERSFEPERVLAEIREGPEYEAAYQPEPLVSVRIATFNLAEILCERALASLLRQSYERWEAVVVGDHCTDDTADRIRSLKDERIQFVNLPWRGPYPDEAKARWYVAGIPAMNLGLTLARGAWIAALDHDDEWDDDHLGCLLSAALEHRAEVAYGQLRILDAATGQQIGRMGLWPPQRGEFGFLGAIQHGALRRFQYDPNCRFADEPGDWNLARRMWEAGVRFHHLERPVASAYFTPRHQSLSTEQAIIEDLRGWASQLKEGLDFWKDQADRHAAEAARLRERS